MKNKNVAIFLDRDGVINKEVNYLSNPDDFEFIPGSIEALKILKELNFLLIIITNQAGIARGFFTEESLKKIHDKMNKILQENSIKLDEIFICPHHPDFTGPCDCRKPSPGMIFKAKEKYNIDLRKSFMVGDTLKDVKTGIAANCKTVLVQTGYGQEEVIKISDFKPDFIFNNLLEFAKNLKIKLLL
ncbi:MAG: D-glycero-beta-D-manno-heptose 1,7-bisphosphate 7-phosphatase [Candidatus Thorarchaeota archaeon]